MKAIEDRLAAIEGSVAATETAVGALRGQLVDLRAAIVSTLSTAAVDPSAVLAITGARAMAAAAGLRALVDRLGVRDDLARAVDGDAAAARRLPAHGIRVETMPTAGVLVAWSHPAIVAALDGISADGAVMAALLDLPGAGRIGPIRWAGWCGRGVRIPSAVVRAACRDQRYDGATDEPKRG